MKVNGLGTFSLPRALEKESRENYFAWPATGPRLDRDLLQKPAIFVVMVEDAR